MQPLHAIAGLGLMLIIYLFIMFAFVITWIYTLVDVIRSDFTNPNNKTMWIIFLLLFAPLATIIYCIIANDQKIPEHRRKKIEPYTKPPKKNYVAYRKNPPNRKDEWKF